MTGLFSISIITLFLLPAVHMQTGNEQRHPAEPEMIFVEGGTFLMGCNDEDGKDCLNDENPQHRVTLGSFYIGKYPITQKQWKAVMGSNPSEFKSDNHPVETVSWDDAQEFIRRLNAATGKQYRLPTEAEWEFAARGGNKSQGYKYSGSNNLNDVALNNENSGNHTHPVGTKQPNELGIFDMSGNVWEWCCDWYGNYRSSQQSDPKGPSSGTYRVDRGGSWIDDAFYCRVSGRDSSSQDDYAINLGFRIVLSI